MNDKILKSAVVKLMKLSLKAGSWFVCLLGVVFVVAPLIAPKSNPNCGLIAHTLRFDIAADQSAIEVGYQSGGEPDWNFGSSFMPSPFLNVDRHRYIMDSRKWVHRLPGIRLRRQISPFNKSKSGWSVAVAPALLTPLLCLGIGGLAGFRIKAPRSSRQRKNQASTT